MPDLLRRRDFRRVFLAASASELGDSLHYIALMWFAFERGGAAGVIAVRLADSMPAILFGLHGGLAADRFSRKRLMVSADLVRAAVLVPVAAAGLTGHLPIWGLAAAAFLLEAAASYFDPAYGALLPTLVERENVQRANGLVQSTMQSISIGGRGLAALLVAFVPVSAFFAVNAASFAVSAALLTGLRVGREHLHLEPETPLLRAGLTTLRKLPVLAIAVVVFAIEITLVEGSWIGGVPKFVGDTLHRGAGVFSLMMIGYGVGSIASGALLSRIEIEHKARVSMLAWLTYLPAFGAIAAAHTLAPALLGAFVAGVGQTTSWVLLNSAAQEEVPDRLLGRVLGVIGLTHRGAHATALVFVAPLFVVASAPAVFYGVALAAPLTAVIGLAVAARALGSHRSRRS
ncbi:MAG TPA: MFS transporter [Gaiellaceae bacterium]